MSAPTCDGMCIDSSDIGVPGYGIAYPHPGCPLHAPDEVCECGTPRRCASPTHCTCLVLCDGPDCDYCFDRFDPGYEHACGADR